MTENGHIDSLGEATSFFGCDDAMKSAGRDDNVVVTLSTRDGNVPWLKANRISDPMEMSGLHLVEELKLMPMEFRRH